MQAKLRLGTAWKAGAALGVAALALAACGSESATPQNTGSTAVTTTSLGAHVSGGTVYWAEPPAVTPNWIFPFASLSFFSVANQQEFQYLMYRPLYWFGPPTASAATVDYALSAANAPTYTGGGKTIVVDLKGWKFHDGQTVDAQSVIFWMNMMKAEAGNWAGYVPGPQSFPGNIVSYSASSPTALSVTFHLTGAFSPTWFTYNELSQIVPIPEAWDVTSLTGAPGSGGCGKFSSGPMTGAATMKACGAVWKFDTDNNGQSKTPQMASDLSTYGSNKLWLDGADGPFVLSAFDSSSGQATFVPNPNYSGPQKPIISKFIEVPYTSDTAEYSALSSGGAGAPDVGYIPPQDVPQYTGNPGGVGTNASQVAANYNLVPVETWQINYFPYNFNSTGDGGQAGAIFKQLPVRQAIQDGIDQLGIIKGYYKGYGVPTYGPVPAYPPNPFESSLEKSPNGPYPFSTAKGMAVLRANGWSVHTGGTDTCAKPGTATGDCGAGISKGTPLSFSEVYESGSVTLTEAVTDEVAQWAKMGIHVSTKQEPFNQVLGYAAPCVPKVTPACQAWELANWGGGWIFSPDYLPTGEEIFQTGAGSNTGDYNDPVNNSLIHQTNISASISVFDKWENYLALHLPVTWQPIAEQLDEVSTKLGGVTPLNSLLSLTPEYWYFKK